MQYNVHEAKTHLSRLLDRVASGEEVVIARAGRPVARVIPYRMPAQDRVPGLDAGLVNVGEDFDDPLPDDLREAFGM